MGGKALGFEGVRLELGAYHMLYDGISNNLSVQLINSYNQKQTFGDMDLLYHYKSITPEVIVSTLEMLGFRIYENIVKNGNITSIGIYLTESDVFQLDFIYVPQESFKFAYHYFSFNDMGNLIGRVARRVGLKFGHDGLWYVQRAPENDNVMLKEHLLTNNFDEALEHLGYDVKRYHEGFDTLEDIFKYVMTSRFYDFNKFDLTQRNHKARIRDAKRPNYRAFLEYAQEHPIVNKIDDVEHYKVYHFGKFPIFYKEYFDVLEQHKQHQEFKSKYNGQIVMDALEDGYNIILRGKELGVFMQSVKDVFTQDFVLGKNQEDINKEIRIRYMSWHILNSTYETHKSKGEVK